MHRLGKEDFSEKGFWIRGVCIIHSLLDVGGFNVCSFNGDISLWVGFVFALPELLGSVFSSVDMLDYHGDEFYVR